MERAQELVLGWERGEEEDPRPYLEEILERNGAQGGNADPEAELFARRWLARMEARAGAWDQVAGHLERAIAVEPTEAGIWADLGETYARTGRMDAAINAIREAVALAPEEPMYAFALGNLYLGPMGSARRALPFLERAAGKRPKEPATLLSLGRCLAALGRRDEARARLERAQELAPAGPVRAAIDEALAQLAPDAGAESPEPGAGAAPNGPATGDPATSDPAPAGEATTPSGGEAAGADTGAPGFLKTLGKVVETFLAAMGANKDQAIGAVVAALLGGNMAKLHDRYAEMARATPGREIFPLQRFQELLGERIRLSTREGLKKLTPEDATRAKELDELLLIDRLSAAKDGTGGNGDGGRGSGGDTPEGGGSTLN